MTRFHGSLRFAVSNSLLVDSYSSERHPMSLHGDGVRVESVIIADPGQPEGDVIPWKDVRDLRGWVTP